MGVGAYQNMHVHVPLAEWTELDRFDVAGGRDGGPDAP